MAVPAEARAAGQAAARIETCRADFDVTAPRGPLSAPEKLLAALRQEILPALSDVLDSPDWQGIDLRAEHVEIDIGDWPDTPVWSDLRHVLALKLREALDGYRPRPVPHSLRDPAQDGLPAAALQAQQQRHRQETGSARPDRQTPAAPPDPSAAPPRPVPRLSDSAVASSLQRFAKWLSAEPEKIPPADILVRLAGHPDEYRALLLWHAAPSAEQARHLSVPGARQRSLHTAVSRLAASATQSPRPGTVFPGRGARHSSTSPDGAPLSQGEHPDPQDISGPRSATGAGLQGLSASAAEETADAPRDPATRAALHRLTASLQRRGLAREPARAHAARLLEHLRAVPRATAPLPAQTDSPTAPRAGASRSVDPKALPGTGDEAATAPMEKAGPARSRTTQRPHNPPIATDLAPSDRQSDRQADPASGGALQTRAGAPQPADPEGSITRHHSDHETPPASPRTAETPAPPARAAERRAADNTMPPHLDETREAASARPDTADPDTPLANRPGPDTAAPNASRIREAFAARPEDTLDAALRSGELARLAAGLADPDASPAIRRAVMALDLERLHALTDANPAALQALLTAMAPSEVLELIARALPPQAELLKRGVARLQQSATHPPTALARAAVAVLQRQAVDLGALAQAGPGTDPLAASAREEPARENPARDMAPPQAGDSARAGSAPSTLTGAEPDPLTPTADEPHLGPEKRKAQDSANAPLAPPDTPTARAGPPSPDAEEVRRDADPQQATDRRKAPPAPGHTLPAQDGHSTPVDDSPRDGPGREHSGDGASALFNTPDKSPGRTGRSAEASEEARRNAARKHARESTNAPAASLDAPALRAGHSTPAADTRRHGAEPPRTGGGSATPAMPADETPVEAFLALSGLTGAEIAHITGSGDGETQAGAPTHPQRPDAALAAHLARLADADAAGHAGDLHDALRLIWRAWPRPEAADGDDPATDFPILLARITGMTSPDPAEATLADRLDPALQVLEPDEGRRLFALRMVAARLASLGGPDLTGLRAATRAAVETLLRPAPDRRTASPGPQPDAGTATPNMQTDRPDFAARPGTEEETLLVTETAGLVLLHPYYALLFERLKIGRDGKALARDALPRALGALHFLAGDTYRNDPLHRVLLGLDTAHPLPDPEMPDDDASDLMDGLLRAVIERWGRLGATSPDGLRETFLRRTGTLRFDETGARLRVTRGPFDMLLDVMPWSTGPVALPWMPLPCHVSWRGDDHA